MSLAMQVGTAAGALATASAAALLWHGWSRHEPSVKRAYRWLAAVAVLWGAGFIAQDAFGGPLTGSTFPLTLADLLVLLALPVLVIGVAAMTAAAPEQGNDHPAPGALARGAIARLADGCLLASALLIIGWLALFGSEYARAGVGAGAFTLDLIRPLADLLALGVLLPFAVRAGRRGLAPSLALLVLAVGDALAVGARTSGTAVGGWPVLTWIAGLCVLGAAALAAPGQAASPRPDPQQAARAVPGLATIVAAATAAVAALVTIGWTLGGGSPAEPVLVVAGAVVVLALVIQVVGLLRRASTVSTISEQSSRQFRDLADRTSDAVLVCDLDGTIRYASPGVAEYGYSPENLEGTTLADLVHPEDRSGGTRIALAAAGHGRQAGRFPCRVRSADGTWRHVESTISRHRETGTADRLLVTARDVSDQVALRRQVTHLTFHDGLTGLPNRAYLEDRAKNLLAQPQGRGEIPVEAGAIFLDLDGFTGVNDSVGHGAGDLLLAQAARRLRAAVPPHDTAARWGGDEFAVLIESAASVQEIVDIAEKLAGSIAAEPFRVAGRDISLTASIGVALADRDRPEHLLRNADVAMSRAKESGGGRVEVFDSAMHTDVVRRLELATDLRQAITEGQLGIEYQPVVELATARVTAVEALVRWSRGTDAVPPGEFIGVAEDSGLIVPLGDWVLREACHQVAAWRASGWDIGLSVNFSLRQVSASRFAESVLAAVQDSGLPPAALTLEVTERTLIEGVDPMAAGLAGIRRRGVRLAIDNFGTGYASLAYLRQIPVDMIKIDPSFVAGLGADTTLAMLTRTIVQVGHDLGLEVVAEGIERPEQIDLLLAMGCRLGQGYLVARPLSARGIEALAEAAGRGDDQTSAGPSVSYLAESEPGLLAEPQAGYPPAGATHPVLLSDPEPEPGRDIGSGRAPAPGTPEPAPAS